MNRAHIYTEEEKKLAVELWQESGLSQYAFSQQEGLVRSTFQNWVKKYSCSASTNRNSSKVSKSVESFVHVQLSSPGPTPGQPDSVLTIHYPNGVKLTGIEGLSSQEVLSLIGVD